MSDAVDFVLGTLAIVLFGAAFAVGWQVIREAWRGAARATEAAPGAPVPARERPTTGRDQRSGG